MKYIFLIFLVSYINLISGFLVFPRRTTQKFEIQKMAAVSSSQTYDDTKVKLIETSIEMSYSGGLHFTYSNSPVAPRTDGGYYIAFTDNKKYLHVLSYDKSDHLLKDFNIMEKANPVDITAIDNGFAVYMIEAESSYHSYLSVYNKNFQLVNKVDIMNNSKDDDKNVDSTLKKQLIRYDSDSNPVFGMRFMYNPDSGKLYYSGDRIFLIFSHYNYFIDSGGHTGDTTVTFSTDLKDIDYGCTWGASHSLIQSVTADDNYFWTAALSDAYPMGIKVVYTSKTQFSSWDKDAVANKNNARVYSVNEELAGKITGYMNGSADGKLGGLLYFEKYNIYCLVYAKTPNPSEDSNKGKNVIYMTTWQFENNKITNAKTIEVKVFSTGNVMQVRAGKFGDDQVFITYSETTGTGGQGYGNVLKGTTPYFTLIEITKLKKLKQDIKLEKLIMNTNEDLRTFDDGVLIWATSNKDGMLSIIKIGTPS